MNSSIKLFLPGGYPKKKSFKIRIKYVLSQALLAHADRGGPLIIARAVGPPRKAPLCSILMEGVRGSPVFEVQIDGNFL